MLWERLAELPLVVDGYGLERLDAAGFDRTTTQFRLSGGGYEGVGEDVGLFDEALHAAGPYLDLAGAWTIARLWGLTRPDASGVHQGAAIGAT